MSVGNRPIRLLTIVTVCLNRADTIGAAIESVLRQDAPDVEHLVVDGGSTDGTLDVIARYPSVRVVSEPDGGLYDAMNKGLRLARGRYVLFLNSDDRLADGVIDKVRVYLEAGYDAVSVGTDIRRIEPDGTVTVIDAFVEPDAIVLSTVSVSLGSPLLNAKFLRRAFVLDKVGFFDACYRLAADVDFLLRASFAEPRVAVLSIVGHHYFEHSGSLTINRTDRHHRQAAEECLAIADAMLTRSDLSRETRFLMRAWRGGKLVALHRLSRFADVVNAVCFGWYLVRRKMHAPKRRSAAQPV